MRIHTLNLEEGSMTARLLVAPVAWMALMSSLVSGPAAHAQAGGYPSKVVTMVVPAAPGVPRTLPRG